MTQTHTATPGPALLSIEGLHKSYGEVEVLKGVDLRMQKGNVVTLIGSSGSGKTTLLRCVNLLEEFQGGVFSWKARTSVTAMWMASAPATPNV